MYDILKNELTTDPLARGYAGMTNAQAAASLNTANCTVDRAVIPANEFVGAIVWTEYTAAATTANARLYLTMLTSAGTVDVKSTNVRAAIQAIFGSGTTTRANLVALQTLTVSRATELGLSRPVEVVDVTKARA